MSPRRRRWSTANALIAILLTAGLFLGVGLVILGGDKNKTTGPGDSRSAATNRASTTTAPRRELPLRGTSEAELTELTGLGFPTGMTDFLTARLKGDSQLDITFVMPTEATAGFISSSGLPALKADKRLILHSSPLWKLNPPEATMLSSTQDDHRDIHRVVELLKNAETGDGKVRARIVITPL